MHKNTVGASAFTKKPLRRNGITSTPLNQEHPIGEARVATTIAVSKSLDAELQVMTAPEE